MVQNRGCVLTGYGAKEFNYVNPPSSVLTYWNEAVGRVVIGEIYYQTLVNLAQTKNPVLAGWCRELHENGEEPVILTKEVAEEFLESNRYPRTLKEKAERLIRHLYKAGGKEGRAFELQNGADYPLCYAESARDFEDVITYLNEGGSLSMTVKPLGGRVKLFKGRLDPDVRDTLEEEEAQGPMAGLVNQEIRTGDDSVDRRIDHARKLFLEQPQTKERMRSAVVELAMILEPLRTKLEGTFGKKDTDVFFGLVNQFDIRHNKKEILRIEHEEQLEWLFFTLLNTLNTYAKLQRKMANVGV